MSTYNFMINVFSLAINQSHAFMDPENDLGELGESYKVLPFEPRHEKTGFLHMRKQRRRSASR